MPESSTTATDRVMSSGQRRQLQQVFERGRTSLREGRPEEATGYLLACARADPGNLLYIQTLLDHLRHPEAVLSRSSFSRLRTAWNLARAQGRNDWITVLNFGLEQLAVRPTDQRLLKTLAGAAEQLSFDDVARRYLQAAWELDPQDANTVYRLARSLAYAGRFEESASYWDRLLDIVPDDPRAREQRDLLAPPARRPSGDMARQIGGLEKQFEADPTDVDVVEQLATCYLALQWLREAENRLQRAMSASPGDRRLQNLLDEVQLAELRRRVEIAGRQAATDPEPAAQKLLDGLEAELNRLELDVFESRCRRYPQDRGARFELARRLKRAGNHAEALRWLEPLRAQDDVPAAVLVEVGECQQHSRQFEQALASYGQAVQAADRQQEESLQTLARYRAAVLAEAMGDWTSAEVLLGELAELDASYKDAPARLDKIRSMRHKG